MITNQLIDHGANPEAAAYFAIAPDTGEKVIHMPVTTAGVGLTQEKKT